jgi:Ran GTPase-activating protein (RanGAP) involved in mRNA processing and transport
MEPTSNCSNGGIGYQEPNVECHLADIDDGTSLLRRLSLSSSSSSSAAAAAANVNNANVADDNIFDEDCSYYEDNDHAVAGLEVWFNDNEYVNVIDDDGDEDYSQQYYEFMYWCHELGCAIGSSPLIRTLRVQDNAAENASLTATFIEPVATNRSIEHLSLNAVFNSGVEIFRIFAPFVEHNHNLRSIEFHVWYAWKLTGMKEFISALANSIRLERIDLIKARMGDHTAADLCNALNSMPGLCLLTNLNLKGNHIGREGCKALCCLLANETTNLQCLNLSENDFDDQCMKDLTNGLTKNHTIKVLDLSDIVQVTPDGWRDFAAYLTICTLERLDLRGIKLGGHGAMSFGIALDLNNAMKLKYLSLSGVKSVTNTGWRVLSNGLCSMAIEELHLCQANIDDEDAVSMVSAVAKTKHLKSLHMGNRSMTSAGWIQCFRLLSVSGIRLEELRLRENSIDDEAAAILTELLVVNNTVLTYLDLSSSESVSSAGWVRCFQLLLGSSNSNLKTLSLDHNEIDDDGARVLVDLLSENYSVSILSLRGYANSMSFDGWLGFRRLLQPSSTSSMLKELNLGAERDSRLLDAEYVALFAQALKGTSLKVLSLFDCRNDDDDYEFEDVYSPTIPICAWDALEKALCDTSSIANVCSSNHSLYKIWEFHWENYEEVIPSEIQTLMRMNRNKNKAEVVRRKLMKHYFSKASNVERTFANFATTMMPDAIGWVGSDRLGFSTMYRLLGSMPWLLQSKPIPIATATMMEPPAKFRKVE